MNNAKGAKHIFINHARLPCYLNLRQVDMVALRESGLIQQEAPIKVPKMRIDYQELAQEYRKRLTSCEFETNFDLANTIGVSRVWISKVFSKGDS